jgi:hypothetical protein
MEGEREERLSEFLAAQEARHEQQLKQIAAEDNARNRRVSTRR